MHSSLIEVADKLREAEKNKTPCKPVRDLIAQAVDQQPGQDVVGLAYEIQRWNTRIGLAEGRRPVGRKIGLTSRSVQKQLGVDQPDFGMLFADMARGDGEVIDYDEVLQPKAEAEIALVLGKDLKHSDNTIADIIGAVEYALPSIEIVGSRVENWDIKIEDTIADNASCGLFVLGTTPVKLGQFDLTRCGMRMMRRGDPVSVGAGAACLGNPLNAAVWLANTMAHFGDHLKAGDILMTGALGPMVEVKAGDVISADIQGLGHVVAEFSTNK